MKKIFCFFLTIFLCVYSCQVLAKTVTITQDSPSQGTYEGYPLYILLSADKLTVNNGDRLFRYNSTITVYTKSSQVDLSTLEKEVYHKMEISSRTLYIYVVSQDNSKSGTTCSSTSKSVVIWTKGPNVKRWERSRDSGSTWTNIACTSYKYTESNPTAGTAKYRVLGTDNTYSDVVTITYVDAVPSTIQATPATNTKTVDESITLTANVTDNGYSYQWKKDGTDISGKAEHITSQQSNRRMLVTTLVMCPTDVMV